ncbi:MAG: Rpn family recombination-promoting nuclease/putative transposase [Deltaproteobacteria bacterium]|nr:Rpn family recombination-promoting nuclease/putative transposase [Deltaproteobacteria bacterium]
MGEFFLSPRNDYVFSRLLGEESSKRAIAGFLSSLLETEIKKVLFLNGIDPYLDQDFETVKLGAVDAKVTTESGEIIYVEVRISSTPHLPQQLMCYGAELIVNQIEQWGETFDTLKKSIFIVITDYICIENYPKYKSHYILGDPIHKVTLTDKTETYVLELPKVPIESDGAPLWSWLKFFDARSLEDLDKVSQLDPVINKTQAKLLNLSADERAIAIAKSRDCHLRDQRSFRFKGHEDGEKVGIETGKEQATMEMAEKLLKRGDSVDSVLALTGLESSKIEHLIK